MEMDILDPSWISDDEEIFDLDTAFRRIGGFGCAQKLAAVFLTVIRNAGLLFVYMFSILTME
jgi:hypothetical protein